MIAFALAFTIALVMLAQPISAMTVTIRAPIGTGDVSDSAVDSGGSNGRKCPDCGFAMKLCLPPSDYKWICHNCGCCVMR